MLGRRRGARLGACGLAACALLLIGAGPAYAVNYAVDSTADGPDVAVGDGVCATALATCTLRAAMQDAGAVGGPSTITLFGLPNPSTIDLGSALPTISGHTLTIVGAGQDALTVRRASGGDYPIFTTTGSDVTIRGMTITQGRGVPVGGQILGGGIYSLAGSLELDDLGVVGNAATMSGDHAFARGGGVYKEQGTLTIRDSTISQNTVDVTSSEDGLGFGGGIAAGSVTDLEVFNSTIAHNSVSTTAPISPVASGGGIVVFGTTIQIVDSTVSANSAMVTGTESAEASGGGIWAQGAAFSMIRSTVDHNSATAANAPFGALVFGGGAYVNGTSVVNVTSSTISANSLSAMPGGVNDGVAGGGLGVLAGALTISGSTLALNAAPQGANLSDAANAARLRDTILSDPLGGGVNCLEAAPNTLVSDGYNVASDASCELTGPGDQPSTNPLLQALANNGGPTFTHALPSTSPALDKGSAAGVGSHPALTTDQRGMPRPVDLPAPNAAGGDGSDIGAFERQDQGYDGTVLAAAPVGYWRFGEASGTALLDSSGHNNNGTYLGGVSLGAPGIPGAAPNTAATYDGVNDTGRVPDAGSLDVGNSFSIEGWIKRSSTAKSYELFNKGANGLQLVVMSAGSGNSVWLRRAGVTTIAQSTAPVLADGQYHHVVATMNGPGTAKIYVDGALASTSLSPVQAIQDTAFPLTFGSAAGAPAQYDEFALYDQVLSPQQIADHHNAGTGL